MGYYAVFTCRLLGSLSNDDGDGNEKGKKAIALDSKNKNFAHDYDVKVPNFTFCREREHHKQLSFSFPEL